MRSSQTEIVYSNAAFVERMGQSPARRAAEKFGQPYETAMAPIIDAYNKALRVDNAIYKYGALTGLMLGAPAGAAPAMKLISKLALENFATAGTLGVGAVVGAVVGVGSVLFLYACTQQRLEEMEKAHPELLDLPQRTGTEMGAAQLRRVIKAEKREELRQPTR